MGAKLWVKFVVGNQPPRFLQMAGSETKLQNAEQIVAALESIGCESHSSSWLQNPPQLRLCKCCDREEPRARFARRQFSRTSPVCKSCAAAAQISLQIASRALQDQRSSALLPSPRPNLPAPRPKPSPRRASVNEAVVVHEIEPRASCKKAKQTAITKKKVGSRPEKCAPVPSQSKRKTAVAPGDYRVSFLRLWRFPSRARKRFAAKPRRFKKKDRLRLVNPVDAHVAPNEAAAHSQVADEKSLWGNAVVTVFKQHGDWVRISAQGDPAQWFETVWRSADGSGDDIITCIKDTGRSVIGADDDWWLDDY